MHTIQDNTIVVDKETTKLQAFRLEDTARAPMIILYVDDNQAELVPLKPGQTPPTLLKSANMEAEVQIITYSEVHSFMHQEQEK
ncbi:MAG: hypothetical protein PHI97_01610 [Desulfobulbus sp.]|nr:hypothetical protein [Desulfobulbus sp.]